MPPRAGTGMTWNAEAHAKLFAAFIKVHDIKPNYTALAQAMGPGCTPKAITHVISKIRAQGNGGSTVASPTSSPGAAVTPKARSTTQRVVPSADTKARSAQKLANQAGIKRKSIEKDSEPEASDKDDEDSDGNPKDYDDIDSGEDANTPSKDRSQMRRSASAKTATFAGIDDDSEEETRASKRVKRELTDDEV